MRKIHALLLGVVVGVCPLLMAPTAGGLPSRPRFQTTTATATASAVTFPFVSTSPTPGYLFDATTAGVDSRYWRSFVTGSNYFFDITTDAGGSAKTILQVTRASNAVSALQWGNATDNPTFAFVGSGAVTSNGNPLTTETSGNFVASFDNACTTTPTITFGYVKIGDVVTVNLKTKSGFPCTADNAGFQTAGTPIPAAIRPLADAISGAFPACTNNGTTVGCNIQFMSNGQVQLEIFPGGAGAWTAAGSRDATSGSHQFSYHILNP